MCMPACMRACVYVGVELMCVAGGRGIPCQTTHMHAVASLLLATYLLLPHAPTSFMPPLLRRCAPSPLVQEFEGKVVGLVAVSGGAMGGLAALNGLRDISRALHAWVVPEQAGVPQVGPRSAEGRGRGPCAHVL